MAKNIYKNGNQISLESNAFTTLMYKKQFNKDFFKELLLVARVFKGKGTFSLEDLTKDDLEAFDTELFYRLFWIFAYTANPDIPDFFEFYKLNSFLTLKDIMENVGELLNASIVTKKKQIPAKRQAKKHLR